MSNQVGGDHYQPDKCGGIEPFTVIDAWGLNFYEGNALKYLARKTKGTDRAEDLRKASHYLAEAADREAGRGK